MLKKYNKEFKIYPQPIKDAHTPNKKGPCQFLKKFYQSRENGNLISNLSKNRELQNPVTYRQRHKNPKQNNINNKSNFTCMYNCIFTHLLYFLYMYKCICYIFNIYHTYYIFYII